MASPSQPFALALSLDSTLQPFLSPRQSSPPSFSFSKQLSLSPLQCTPTPQTSLSPQTFLSPPSITKKQTLSSFTQHHTLSHGTLQIRRMLDSELDSVSNLLAESFIETLHFPQNYARLLAFLVKNYLLERRALEPHATVLVGVYGEGHGAESEGPIELACTAEISFDARGANAASPTPVPPPECPYICNMTVRKSLRRRGIAKQLLKTCEDLIAKMSDQKNVYLHCRMVDKVPQNLYKKAGYQIAKTDSFLVWLSLQRRKYLMCKELPEPLHDET